ncbi:hypothetical protein [uncultured Sphingobacterium sp.]|uniref:hypothetical protein n=1 Tax=uncultured Sphingobacterium sp. TaxID=182688 RepID=UPI00374A10BD
MRQLGYIDEGSTKKPLTFYMEDKKAKKVSTSDVTVESDQRGEIARLKRELEESRIREEYYLTMIEKAERELHIDIRKKSSTK